MSSEMFNLERFRQLTGRAVTLMLPDINTGVILPAKYSRLATEEMGKHLFEPLRRNEDGTDNKDFFLNQERNSGAEILIAGRNFGCGSANAAALRALASVGVRCVIAESFGEMFYDTCLARGVMPAQMSDKAVEELVKHAQTDNQITVDMQRQVVLASDGREWPFEMEKVHREVWLSGLDEVGHTLQFRDEILAWQNKDKQERPWVWQLQSV